MTTALRVAAALKNLPPFPPAAAKALRLLADESVSFREISDTLGTDAALSAEVLRLANSPLFGPRYSVSSISHALSVVGTRRLTGLVFTLSMSKFLKRLGKKAIMRRSWRHNLACAFAAKEFAKSFSRDASEAYNAGLFHDVGRLAFMTVSPGFYERFDGCDADLRKRELDHFGIDHCDAGAWVIEQWQLPEQFAEVAHHHHAPQPEDELTMLVNAACVVANRLGFSVVSMDAGQVDLNPDDPLCSLISGFIGSLEREYGM
jgi:putative nucleotidyltransferase with HDIG domain